MAAPPPHHHHHHPPPPPPLLFPQAQPPPSKLPIDFSPPLIAMVVVAAAALLLVTYSRLISRHLFPPFLRLLRRYKLWRRRRRRRLLPHFDLESPPPPLFDSSSDALFLYSPYGLDDSVIKNIPLTIYKPPKSSKRSFLDDDFHDCAVCLLEFEDGDYTRTLPLCSHSFHVECIDIWLRSHATCPLCRARVFLAPESPFTPVMASRIRPSFDDGLILESMYLEPLVEGPEQNSGEIQPARSDDVFSPVRIAQSEDHRSNRRELDFLLKRSYSFGFERSFPSEQLVLEPVTTPYHHHRHHRRRSLIKRPSSTPFSSIAKSRVFSFRHYRGTIKSPAFFRRRSLNYGGADLSSRRLKFFNSPLFGRVTAAPTTAMVSSSRMRCGDPEALLSPERYSGR